MNTTQNNPNTNHGVTEKFLDDWLEQEYQAAIERLRNKQHKHEDLTIIMLKHQTNHMNHLEKDLRGDIVGLHSQLGTEISNLRSEITNVRTELSTEIRRLDERITASNQELGDKINGQTWKMIMSLGFFTAIIALVIKL